MHSGKQGKTLGVTFAFAGRTLLRMLDAKGVNRDHQEASLSQEVSHLICPQQGQLEVWETGKSSSPSSQHSQLVFECQSCLGGPF